MRKIEIACNRKVRDYTTKHLKSLTGLSVDKAYELLKKEGCLPVPETMDILSRGKKLLKAIENFKFPASVPVRPVDERHLWQFRERWAKHLQGTLDKLVSSSKPVYLVDEVSRQLHRRKSSIQCSRVHLIWYLDMYGEENMTPEAIATAIIKFGVTDWSKVQPLKNNAKYIFNVTDENTEVDQEEFIRMVEFIWSIPKPRVQEHLNKKIMDDIIVIEEFSKLWESGPTTYDYKKVFEDYVSRLKTLPSTKKKVSLKRETKRNGKIDSSPLEPWQDNYLELSSYLGCITENDEPGKRKIDAVKDRFDEFCKLENFREEFDDLKKCIENSHTPFKGGYAASVIINKTDAHRADRR